jgi:DNA repair exonuclease SbcCD nuclease subunit
MSEEQTKDRPLDILSKESIEKSIRELKVDLKIDSLEIPSEIDALLKISRRELKTKDVEELSIDYVRLTQYAIYVRQQMNKINSVIAWCESNIESIVGREANNTQGYGIAEKRMIICRNDIHAKKFFEVSSLYKAKKESISELDSNIHAMSQAIKNLTFVRRAN